MTQQSELDGGASHRADFRLSITRALKDQLAQALDDLEPAPLSMGALEELERRGGIYQLHHGERFVYVGKADKNLPQRIGKHLRKISGRNNISVGEMRFACLYVDEDFPAVAPERLLIAKYREKGEIPWNTNGFGNNDPGRRRDDTVIKVNHFDVRHPIDLDRVIPGVKSGATSLRQLLADVKKQLPYNFRYAIKALGAMGDREVGVPEGELTAGDLFSLIGETLTEQWQIAVLHGYAIMYPEGERNYPSAWRYYRMGQVVDVDPEIDQEHAEIIEEDDAEEG
ncbi:GIY-YIG nuclease family protein [Streptomyces sp. NPDC102451]|uniref:GIY-YIG nuclease family protein n=1 Tax=Streptomyces sp. NPDC102451 TaxID=3366177 RepID=UPI0037FD7D8D